MTLRRDWADAREKVDREGACRWCGQAWGLDAAHVVGRAHDQRERGASIARVNPDSVILMDGSRVTPGTKGCHCDEPTLRPDGHRRDCSWPCHQRLGVTSVPCCPDCAELPEVDG